MNTESSRDQQAKKQTRKFSKLYKDITPLFEGRAYYFSFYCFLLPEINWEHAYVTSLKELSLKSSLNYRTVKKIIAVLEKMGLIRVEKSTRSITIFGVSEGDFIPISEAIAAMQKTEVLPNLNCTAYNRNHESQLYGVQSINCTAYNRNPNLNCTAYNRNAIPSLLELDLKPLDIGRDKNPPPVESENMNEYIYNISQLPEDQIPDDQPWFDSLDTHETIKKPPPVDPNAAGDTWLGLIRQSYPNSVLTTADLNPLLEKMKLLSHRLNGQDPLRVVFYIWECGNEFMKSCFFKNPCSIIKQDEFGTTVFEEACNKLTANEIRRRKRFS